MLVLENSGEHLHFCGRFYCTNTNWSYTIRLFICVINNIFDVKALKHFAKSVVIDWRCDCCCIFTNWKTTERKYVGMSIFDFKSTSHILQEAQSRENPWFFKSTNLHTSTTSIAVKKLLCSRIGNDFRLFRYKIIVESVFICTADRKRCAVVRLKWFKFEQAFKLDRNSQVCVCKYGIWVMYFFSFFSVCSKKRKRGNIYSSYELPLMRNIANDNNIRWNDVVMITY